MRRLVRTGRLGAEVPSTLEHRRDASRLAILVRYLAQHERGFRRPIQALEAEEPEADKAAEPNEPELPPRAEPPRGLAVAVLRQEVARLVADEEWRMLERGLAEGRYAPLGLGPLPEGGRRLRTSAEAPAWIMRSEIGEGR